MSGPECRGQCRMTEQETAASVALERFLGNQHQKTMQHATDDVRKVEQKA